MLYSEIKGRLGNQLFRYAFTRAVQKQRGRDEKIMFSFNSMDGKNSSDGWEDSLKYFNVIPHETYTGNGHMIFHKSGLIQCCVAFVYYLLVCTIPQISIFTRDELTMRCKRMLNKHGLLLFSDSNYDYMISQNKNCFIDGDVQYSRYFSSIRKELIDEITPIQPLLLCNETLYHTIISSQSVCITIRRGDYVTNEEFKKVYDVCGVGYFKEAISVIKSKVKDPVFIVFSDDIDWAKNNLNIEEGSFYFESGLDPIWEKLRLMSSCKHFIISNSTFSWWAQYLGTYPNKVVVSPDKWYNDGRTSQLIEDSFIKIKV